MTITSNEAHVKDTRPAEDRAAYLARLELRQMVHRFRLSLDRDVLARMDALDG